MTLLCRYLLMVLLLTAAAAAEPVEVTVRAVPGQPTIGSAPMTIRVDLTHDYERFQGWLEVAQMAGYFEPVLRQEVDVGRGSYAYFLYPSFAGASTNRPAVRLVDSSGLVLHLQELPVHNATDSILAVMPEEGPQQKAMEPPVPAGDTYTVMPLYSQELLPDAWRGWTSRKLLFWHGAADPTLSPAQQRALREWLYLGGVLIVEPDGRSLLAALGLPNELQLRAMALKGEGVITAGQGRVCVIPDGAPLPVDLDVRHFLRSDGRGGYVRKAVREIKEEVENIDFSYLNSYSVPVLPDLWDHDALPPFVGASLPESLRVERDELRTPLMVLALFVIVGTLGDWLLLRRSRRRPWTWLTFPLLCAAFSGLAFAFFNQSNLAGKQITVVVEARYGESVPIVTHRYTYFRQEAAGQMRLEVPPDARLQMVFYKYQEWGFGFRIREELMANGRRYLEVESVPGTLLQLVATSLREPASAYPSMLDAPSVLPVEGGAVTVPASALAMMARSGDHVYSARGGTWEEINYDLASFWGPTHGWVATQHEGESELQPWRGVIEALPPAEEPQE